MLNQDLISVIIPIYNVEKYLEKCVNSVLEQTYTNLEIILVDDGCTDNCPIICDNLSKKDNRIKVIHKTYSGVSDSRNVGIESSTGKYISFIDSDDYVNKYFLETLYNNLIETNSDISICGFQKVYENTQIDTTEKLIKSEIEIFKDIDKFKQLYNQNAIAFVVVWSKLYKSEIFKNTDIRFEKGKIHEDEIIIHYILHKSEIVSWCNTPLYYYLKRKNSIMGQKISEKNLYIYYGLQPRSLFFKENYPELFNLSLKELLYNLIGNYFYNYNKNLKKKAFKIFKDIKSTFKSDIKNLPLKNRIIIFLFSHFKPMLNIYYSIKKLNNKNKKEYKFLKK